MSLEGQRFGEFEIIERIGQGGMGAVYRAVQTSLQRTVAFKTLQPVLAGDPEYIARFHREAVAAAGLSHQNLVQVYAAGQTDGLHWFAMEFVKGESAYTRLKRKGCVEAGEAIAMGVHLANALDYAWKRAHLIHRDIKPDNIFLSGDGDVKLGDLGLAKVADQTQSLTMTGASMGTPHYVSPEQAQGRKDVDLRADIYSLGCTLYHLVSGQTPFTGENALAVMMLHVTTPPPDIRGVFPACPRVLAEVIFKMMQKDPAARQQDYAAVNADLRRAYDVMTGASVPTVIAVAQHSRSGGIPAAGEGGGDGKTAAKSRRSLVVAGVAVAVCAVGALLYFAPWKERTPTTATGMSPLLGKATKDQPFVNTLGMKFVPVPGTAVLFCIYETRVKDYAEYANEISVPGIWKEQVKEGVPISDGAEHPVSGVNWKDANGFCEWLTKKEVAAGKLAKGMEYRLPTNEEWSRAVGLPGELQSTPKERSGKGRGFPWGDAWPPAGKAGNYADETFHGKFPQEKQWVAGYTDGFATSPPAGSFAANSFGIHDLGGNVFEWCEDWYDAEQKNRVLRGASWKLSDRDNLLSSYRSHGAPGDRGSSYGFRCVVGASAP
jgi:hypothetical protein